jgi:hypothetical protein
MKSSMTRTIIITALLTAVAISGLAMYVGPKIFASKTDAATPAVTNTDQQSTAPATAQAQPSATQQRAHSETPHVRKRSHHSDDDYASSATTPEPVSTASNNNNPQDDSYGEPHKGRSLAKSALIVGGGAGTGAAVGALVGGGKGAAIGALAGGGAGLIYDRATAHK